MNELADLTPSSLDPYVPIVGAAEVEELRALAGPLEGSTVDMVNSTAVGGGVAELLTRLLPLMRGVGLEGRWHVMDAAPEFFEVTKAFHNALHGGPYQAKDRDFEIFREYSRRNQALDAGIPLRRHSRSSTSGAGRCPHREPSGALDLEVPYRFVAA